MSDSENKKEKVEPEKVETEEKQEEPKKTEVELVETISNKDDDDDIDIPETLTKYKKVIDGLKKANIEINRKVLSEIAFHEPAGFKSIVEKAKSTLAS